MVVAGGGGGGGGEQVHDIEWLRIRKLITSSLTREHTSVINQGTHFCHQVDDVQP